MKAILTLSLLLCSNALASPVHSTSPPSNEVSPLASPSGLTSTPSNKPTQISALPTDVLNMNILPRTSSTDRKMFKLSDKQNFERVDLTPVDKFLLICQSVRYLACLESAHHLEESSRPFALQKAIEEGKVWAVSALLDNGQFFGPEFVFEIFENYLKVKGSNQNLIILDVLRRKTADIDPARALVLACTYKNQYLALHLLRDASPETLALDQVKAYKTELFGIENSHMNPLVSIDQAFAACKAADSFFACYLSLEKISPRDRPVALVKAIQDGNLWAAEVLARTQDRSFADYVNVIKALKYAITLADKQKIVYVLLQPFPPSTLLEVDALSHACAYGNQFTVFYATKDTQAADLPRIVAAYEQAKNYPNKDTVKYFQEIFAVHGYPYQLDPAPEEKSENIQKLQTKEQRNSK